MAQVSWDGGAGNYVWDACQNFQVLTVNARRLVSDRYVYLFPLRDQQVGRSDRPSDDEADVDISFVDENLKMLVGKRLDYTAFARDTPPGQL